MQTHRKLPPRFLLQANLSLSFAPSCWSRVLVHSRSYAQSRNFLGYGSTRSLQFHLRLSSCPVLLHQIWTRLASRSCLCAWLGLTVICHSQVKKAISGKAKTLWIGYSAIHHDAPNSESRTKLQSKDFITSQGHTGKNWKEDSRQWLRWLLPSTPQSHTRSLTGRIIQGEAETPLATKQ